MCYHSLTDKVVKPQITITGPMPDVDNPYDLITQQSYKAMVFPLIYYISLVACTARAPSQYKDRLIYVWRFPC